jgi:hypothetical protein
MSEPIKISQEQARRFLLAHHALWPPRQLAGKAGVLDYLDRVGCIQFDTISVVTRNADLVLQARVKNYRPTQLKSMLYEDRSLWDGWDKVQSIYRAADWPHFEPQRQRMRAHYAPQLEPKGKLAAASMVREAIRERGPLSSIDIDHDERLAEWSWGGETRAVRASMEVLYAIGELGVHQRINTRREFDLVERLLPAEVLGQAHPHTDLAAYHDWHVLRRIGSIGLTFHLGTDHWLGISNLKAPARYAALDRLLAAGAIRPVEITGMQHKTLYMRTADLPTLDAVSRGRQPNRQAAFIAPLDNLIWQRDLLEALFGFFYRWEVYVPADKREYGYYVMPVLYGDDFVARMDPKLDPKTKVLTINGWWWQPDTDPANGPQRQALARALRDFSRYLEAKDIVLGDKAMQTRGLREILAEV